MGSGTINDQPPIFRQQEPPLGEMQQKEIKAGGDEYNKGFVDVQLKPSEQLQPGIHEPSKSGISETTTEPGLTPPNWNLVSTAESNVSLGSEFLSIIGYNLTETVTSFLGETVPEDELAYIRETLQEEFPSMENLPPTGENPPVEAPETPPVAGSALLEVWNNIETAIEQGKVDIPEGQQQIVENMSSQDPETVKQTLYQIINLDPYNLTAEQKTLVDKKLGELAENIAGSIAEEGNASFFIRFGMPELLAFQMSTAMGISSDTSLSEADKELLNKICTEAGTNLASINFSYATSIKPPSAEYTQLTSQDSQQLSLLMTNLLHAVAIPEGAMTEEERSLFIATLAEAIGGKPLSSQLSSCNEEEISEYLTTLINQLVKEGKLPANTALMTNLTLYAIPGLSQKICSINKTKYLNDLYSTDSDVINNALHKLGDISSMPDLESLENLSPDEITAQYGTSIILESYLKVLVKALSFLAQIRCLISNLEGKFSQELAKAKQAALADQVAASTKMMEAEFTKLGKEFGVQLKQIAKAATMRWVLPLISIFAAVIALALAVATVFTGPAAIAGISAIVAAVVIIASVATFALSIADAVLSACGKPGVFEMLSKAILDACGASDAPPWLKSLVQAIVQFVIMIAITLLTLGAGIGIALAHMGKEALKQILVSIAKAFVQSLALLLFTVTIQPLLSSGLLMQVLLLALNRIFPKDDMKATIIAAIIQLIIMIIVTIALFVIQGKINTQLASSIQTVEKATEAGAKTAAETTKTVATTVQTTTKAAQNIVTEHLGKIFASLVKALSKAAEDSPEFLKSFMELITKIIKGIGNALCKGTELAGKGLTAAKDEIIHLSEQLVDLMKRATDSLLKSMKNPTWWIQALDTTKNLLTIGVSIYSGVTSLQQAQYQKQLARMHREIAELEANLNLLQSLNSLSLDQTATLKNISKDTEETAKVWAGIVNMVASFIQDASKNLNTLVTSGSAR